MGVSEEDGVRSEQCSGCMLQVDRKAETLRAADQLEEFDMNLKNLQDIQFDTNIPDQVTWMNSTKHVFSASCY